ncbi:MAG: pyruvate ferredoxin oxidoreductase [Firmicutes bacterium]|nr:pyruvate ferredoxin oxidoreductase [Bacillota bacterium]
MSFNVVITGVGGQGNVLASRILAQAAMHYGLDVRTSEAIGMAQREGVVMSQVRMGDNLYSALIPNGMGDVLLGFELAETVRGLPKINKNAVVVANQSSIVPVSTTLGVSQYHRDQLIGYLKENTNNLYLFDATALAKQAGTHKAVNIVMLGALAALNVLPYDKEHLLEIVLRAVPEKFKEINIKAFELGFEAVEVN